MKENKHIKHRGRAHSPPAHMLWFTFCFNLVFKRNSFFHNKLPGMSCRRCSEISSILLYMKWKECSSSEIDDVESRDHGVLLWLHRRRARYCHATSRHFLSLVRWIVRLFSHWSVPLQSPLQSDPRSAGLKWTGVRLFSPHQSSPRIHTTQTNRTKLLNGL